ncbi:MAG TPA: hypothetical protein VE258_17820, partial [Ktedonobacterales bacterium]|nr:hypothetical protein [Ktedonobacterales bacterium]
PYRVLLAVSDLLIAGGRRLRPTQAPAVSPRALAAPAMRLPLLPSAGRPTITMQLVRRDSEAFCLTYCRLDAPRPATAPGVTYLALLWQPDRFAAKKRGKEVDNGTHRWAAARSQRITTDGARRSGRGACRRGRRAGIRPVSTAGCACAT